ncbi:hypothetical protein V1264_001353 [Littorina saxatilis]|uniref:Zinc finger CCCH domain-containing protein 3 n=1 Tax=Littorina saxatilis TaxID=31220 RepID=A0AAN9C258_9CAEN
MRKKIGVMLKESPQKSRQLKSSLAAASQQQRTDLLTISVPAAKQGCVPKEGTYAVCRSMPQESQPVTDNGQRPFPNRTSLRWTPQTSPLRTSSSETLLVVGSSPSVRIPHKSSYKVDSSKLKQSETRTSHSSQPHSGQKRNSLVVKKSRFCLRRTPSGATSSTPKEYPPASKLLPVQNSLQSGGAKPFVGRYKLQRLNRGSPKAAISGKNPQGKFTVTSRYKLIKSGSREMPSTQQVSRSFTIPRTASQRAARVIKSKYKIRTVLLPVSPAYHSLPKKQLQYSSNYHKDRSYNSCQPFAWKTKMDKYNNMRYSYVTAQRFPFQSTSTFALAAAIKGQYPFRRNTGGNSAMFFYGGPWSGRKTDYYSSKQWWTNPYQRTSSYQQSHRAKAVAAWKRQQKMNALAAGLPHNHWQTKVFEAKREQQRKRLLLKRLQWMKKYNLTRKRLNRRESSPTKSSLQDSKQENLVMINGILYKSSSRRLTKASSSATKFRASASASAFGSASQTKLSSAVVVRNVKQHKMQTVTVRGISFTMDSRGTKLRRVQSSNEQDKSAAVSRVDVGGTTYIQNKEGILEKISDNQSRSVINRVKQRSIARVAAKFKKDNTKSKKKNCLFYSRFGKCSRGDSCPFLHDPEKIAVCTRFLRGTCKVENCPFSHKVSKEKMPVCAFFLRGVCTRENCPYLHVKVSQGAEICKDFVNGFCPLAEKCQKMHTLTCPHFAKTGVCPEGKKCRLLHRKVNRRQKQRATSPGSTTSDIM